MPDYTMPGFEFIGSTEETRRIDMGTPVCYEVPVSVLESIRCHVEAAKVPRVGYTGDMADMRDIADIQRIIELDGILSDIEPYK